MSLRRLPPVHSPITLAALGRGAAALAGGSAAGRAEAEIGEWLQRTFSPRRWLLVDSGTSALRLALQHAVEGRAKRRIALPAYGCYDLATACDGAAVEVVLYDIDPETLGPDWASYEAALGTDPAAVVLVHLYGVPVDLERATALARSAGVRVIEDAAQGPGGSFQGRALGSFGDYAVLSFGRGKGITGGGGGALLLHTEVALDPPIPPPPAGRGGFTQLVLALAQGGLSQPWIYWLPASLPFLGLGETRYRLAHDPTGMTAASLGLLAGNLVASGAESEVRRRTAGYYHTLLDGSGPLGVPQVPGSSVAGYLRFPVLGSSWARALLQAPECERLGVGRGYPGTLADLAGFHSRFRGFQSSFPGADQVVEELLTLPTHQYLAATELAHLSALVRRAAAEDSARASDSTARSRSSS